MRIITAILLIYDQFKRYVCSNLKKRVTVVKHSRAWSTRESMKVNKTQGDAVKKMVNGSINAMQLDSIAR